MRTLPSFSRAQQGVILLLGAALLLLWAWRANFFLAPSPPPPRDLTTVFVEVSGSAAHPGVYSFAHPPTLAEVWRQSGGTGTAPDRSDKITSGHRVEIGPDGHYQLLRMGGAQLLTLGLALDLNTANVTDLDALPGIGPALAQRIVDYRQQHGPFKTIEDLEKVSGIGAAKLEKLKPYVIITEADERR